MQIKYECPAFNISGKSGQGLLWTNAFLARQDECPESYCRTSGVGVRVHVHKNLNLAYNS